MFYNRLRITLNFKAVDVASASTILTDSAYLVGLKPDKISLVVFLKVGLQPDKNL
jgi:hypothetical protein